MMMAATERNIPISRHGDFIASRIWSSFAADSLTASDMGCAMINTSSSWSRYGTKSST